MSIQKLKIKLHAWVLRLMNLLLSISFGNDAQLVQYQLPDIVTYLQNETKLTRKNIVDILIKSGKLESFKNNPQKFIDGVIAIIRKTMSIFHRRWHQIP